MYSVLIVDDEPAALEGMRRGLQWKECRVDNLYTATSVQHAKEIFKRQRVDVMFCDIEMPKENGLVLVEWVRAEYPETVSILLTCHADFDYIHKAMTCGAFDYLLKPTSYDAVEDVLRRALDRYRKQCEKDRYAGYGERWVQHSELVREQILRGYLTSPLSHSVNYLSQKLESHGLSMDMDTDYSLALCAVWSRKESFRNWEPEDLDYAFKNVLYEVFGASCTIVTVPQWSWCILQPAGAQSVPEQKEAFKRVMQFAVEYTGCEVCFYTAQPAGLDRLNNIYQEFVALHRNNVAYGSRVVALEQQAEKPQVLPPQTEAWRKQLDLGDFSAFQSAVEEYMAAVVGKGGADARFLLVLYHNVVQLLYAALDEKGIQAGSLLQEFTACGQWERVPETVEQMRDFLRQVLNVAAESIARTTHTSELVRSVEQYVREHIRENIRRDDIAAAVYLNPAYLSRAYKEKRGISLSEYITKTRLELVKKYLRETEMSITAIAYETGYTSMPYLSRQFREETGMTPQEYRRRHR